MNEAQLTTKYSHYVKSLLKITAGWEFKIVHRPKRFYLKDIREHQINNLYKTKHGCFWYKMPDQGIGQKPYDAVSLYKEPAYLTVFFYEARKPKNFYCIDIDAIIGLIDDNKVSITEDEARSYSTINGVLK